MKKIAIFIMAASVLLPAFSKTIIDTYRFKMVLNVPRIYDNMQSKGYRKYQKQTIQGELKFIYDDETGSKVEVYGLENKTHKISGRRITYECSEYPYDDNMFLSVGLGSNRTLKFNQSGVRFSFVADPSYNIGEVDEDNSLYLELSGHGKMKSKSKYCSLVMDTLKGSVTGRIGCGCSEYGHISPTRMYMGYLNYDWVIDIAPLDGTWTAKFKSRIIK